MAKEYTIKVEFTRNLADDLEVCEIEESNPDKKAILLQQFRRELQMHYDTCAMAGHFEITKLEF